MNSLHTAAAEPDAAEHLTKERMSRVDDLMERKESKNEKIYR